MKLENGLSKIKKGFRVWKGDVNATIERIQEESKKVEPDSDEFRRLRASLEQEYKNKKLAKELRRGGLSWDRILMVMAILAVAGFGFALDLESPKALKIAGLVLKLPMVKV